MKLNPALDVAALSSAYRRDRRGQVVGLLTTSDAAALHADISAQRRWNVCIFAHGKNTEVDAEGWSDLAPDVRAKTIEIAHDRANHEFAFLHYKIPVYDRYHGGSAELTPALKAWFEFMNGEEFLGFARSLTGHDDIAFADAQLTAFGPGHFITIHNDDSEGKNRRAAYVLNMTPEWREDWGGYLLFFDGAGNVTTGYKPAFNTLNVFSIPAAHSVSVVSPFARKPRLAISGWLRAGVDPARRGSA